MGYLFLILAIVFLVICISGGKKKSDGSGASPAAANEAPLGQISFDRAIGIMAQMAANAGLSYDGSEMTISCGTDPTDSEYAKITVWARGAEDGEEGRAMLTRNYPNSFTPAEQDWIRKNVTLAGDKAFYSHWERYERTYYTGAAVGNAVNTAASRAGIGSYVQKYSQDSETLDIQFGSNTMWQGGVKVDLFKISKSKTAQ